MYKEMHLDKKCASLYLSRRVFLDHLRLQRCLGILPALLVLCLDLLPHDHDLPVLVKVDDSVLPLGYGRRQETLGELVLEEPRDGPPQGPRAVDGVEAFVHDLFLDGVGQRECEALLEALLEAFTELQLCDLANLRFGERPEDDELVQTVQELRPEEILELIIDLLLEALVVRDLDLVLRVHAPEAEAAAAHEALLDDLRADV
mmetsp:Transcript_154251/g.494618  ORF Transcript_154251/g.494618 Transcript_154251/m.494618 type:complete len:203 (+) Transcript_154251:228-836(+)